MKSIKKFAVVLLSFFALTGFIGCGSASQDAPITSEWKVTEITTKGETKKYDGLIANIVMTKDLKEKVPVFKTTDGTNLIFSNNGKDHQAQIVQKGDEYIIYWLQPDGSTDPEKTSTATIDGNILTFKMTDTITVKFKAK